jgi:hypothetical protein
MTILAQARTAVGNGTAAQTNSDPEGTDFAAAAAFPYLEPTELLLLLGRRRELDQSKDRIVFTGFDVCHPDGRPMSVGINRFCQQGTRLLLGRARHLDRALVRMTIFPVTGLNAPLTRVSRGVRCRRLYALRTGDEIRFHFLDGTPTEMVFQDRLDDRAVLDWLRAAWICPGIPFWFDLACEVEDDGKFPAQSS